MTSPLKLPGVNGQRQGLARLLCLGCFAGLIAITSTRIAPSDEAALATAVLHRPSKAPDRIILSWTADPATTQTVTWRTDKGASRAIAQIALAEDGPDFAKKAQEVAAATSPFRSDLGEANFHSVRFTGLQPDTMYAYRVGDGWNFSEWHQFRTASDQPRPLTFIYGGDAQNDILSHWSRVIRTAYSHAPDARFIIHAGDLANTGLRDYEWGEWFRAAGWINAIVPSLPTPGNHEYPRSGDNTRSLAPHWRAQFSLPENGPSGLEETCYYLDIQGVRIVSLNSNERLEEQTRWLDALLSGPRLAWTVLAFHHPLFSAAKNRDNRKLRDLWQPVFDKHRVDLVLQGHDHTYGRSNLVSGVNVRARSGTVYVVSVSGPKMYEVNRQPWMARAAERTQLFQIVRIAGNTLRYEARTPRGLLYDAFELRKRSGRPNSLVNRIPATPERLGLSTAAPVSSARLMKKPGMSHLEE